MYVLSETQVIVPILALLICLGVFILGVKRGITMKRDEADRFARIVFDGSDGVSGNNQAGIAQKE